MTSRQLKSLQKVLLPEISQLEMEQSLLLVPNSERLLRAIHFESSSFDNDSFYVNYFILPYCVPTDHLYFNFGNRVRHNGGDRWNIQTENLKQELIKALKEQALDILLKTNSLNEFVNLAKRHLFSANPHTPKTIALCLAREHRFPEALAVIHQLIPALDLKVPWQVEIRDLVSGLKSKIMNSPLAAIEQLEAWEKETLINLKLGLGQTKGTGEFD